MTDAQMAEIRKTNPMRYLALTEGHRPAPLKHVPIGGYDKNLTAKQRQGGRRRAIEPADIAFLKSLPCTTGEFRKRCELGAYAVSRHTKWAVNNKLCTTTKPDVGQRPLTFHITQKGRDMLGKVG